MRKEYLVKIHDKDNVFKKTLSGSEVKDGAFTFSRTISSQYGPMTIDYNKRHSDFDLVLFDTVYVYCDGVLIYRGFLDSYEEIYSRSSEFVRLTVVGMQVMLKNALYEVVSNQKVFTKDDDPATIIDEILAYINSQRGWTIFNTGLTSYGSDIYVEFSKDDCLNAIKKVVKNTDRFIDFLPNGDVVFQSINESVADHSLTFGEEITDFSRTVDGIDLVNDLYVYYDGGFSHSQDIPSQTIYGPVERYIEDTSLQDEDSGDERLAVEIAISKNPKYKTIVTVNSNYSLESINIGDTIRIKNKSNESAYKGVHRIDYRENLAVLYLDDFESMEKSLLQLK